MPGILFSRLIEMPTACMQRSTDGKKSSIFMAGISTKGLFDIPSKHREAIDCLPHMAFHLVSGL
jgi:hypothetical protein